MDTKELTVVKTKVTKLQNQAQQIIINSPETYNEAADIVAKLKESGSTLKILKESITKPLNEALKNARGMFAPVEDDHEKAEMLIKRKLLDYKQEQDRLVREKEAAIARKLAEEKAKLDAQVAAGQITEEKAEEKFDKKLEKAEEKIDTIDRIENTTKSKNGSVQVRKIKKVRIVDESLVPRSYLQVNEVLVRKDALSGVAIPGVEVYEEESLSISTL